MPTPPLTQVFPSTENKLVMKFGKDYLCGYYALSKDAPHVVMQGPFDSVFTARKAIAYLTAKKGREYIVAQCRHTDNRAASFGDDWFAV